MKINTKWAIGAFIIGMATAIDLAVPDPVPFVDEIALMALTIYGMFKTIF